MKTLRSGHDAIRNALHPLECEVLSASDNQIAFAISRDGIVFLRAIHYAPHRLNVPQGLKYFVTRCKRAVEEHELRLPRKPSPAVHIA